MSVVRGSAAAGPAAFSASITPFSVSNCFAFNPIVQYMERYKHELLHNNHSETENYIYTCGLIKRIECPCV